MKKFALVVTIGMLCAGAAHAQFFTPAASSPTRFLVGMGLSGGGESLATVVYEDGNSHTLKTGGLIYFTAGFDHRINQDFSVQGTINYHFDASNAKNGDLRYSRIPVELITYYHASEKWRVGGGVRYVSSPKIHGTGIARGIDYNFKNSVSAVVETEYFFHPKIGVKLRYVNEALKMHGYSSVDASHVGLSGNYYF